MKKIISALAITAVAFPAIAQNYVSPHIRKDGTYVQGHYRSAPDGNRYNNYSTQGNYNPYTGKSGTVSPYSQPTSQPGYYQGGTMSGQPQYRQPKYR